MTLKLILFDLDDTLCDYASARAQRLRIAFSTAVSASSDSCDVDLDVLIAESIQIHPHGADHFGSLLASHGIVEPAAAARAKVWYQTHRFHGLTLFPDALATLEFARGGESRRTVGLITNGPADVQRAKIELLGLERSVDFVVISGEFGVAKPDIRIFTEALRLGSAEPAESLIVGDSPEFDIAGAHAAGIRSVWMNRTGRAWSHPSAEPDHEIAELSSLASLLDGVETRR